jgi:hypothetical protein
MKICTKCKNPKELEDFPIKKITKDGHGYICKKCQRDFSKKHYYNNKKQYSIRNKRRAKEAKEFIINIKKNSICKCGEKRWWVLEFHHNNNNDKYEDVSKLINYGIVAVKKEIKKCEILCANCHKDFHHNKNALMV